MPAAVGHTSVGPGLEKLLLCNHAKFAAHSLQMPSLTLDDLAGARLQKRTLVDLGRCGGIGRHYAATERAHASLQ